MVISDWGFRAKICRAQCIERSLGAGNGAANPCSIARAERDGTRAETRLLLSPKRTSPFNWVGTSVQSTAGSRVVRISLSNAG